MPQSGFTPSAPKPIERPPCPLCGAEMFLARIEPDKPDHDKRTFACTKCAHEAIVVVKYK